MDYEAAQAEQCVPAEGQGICVGADETFFGLPVLVLLELSSGYIFIETECENRTYATWMEQVNQWWQDSPWQCHYLVSDGARALVKLAVSGLGCVSVADLFHALRALGKPMGRSLKQQAATLKKQQDKLQQQLKKRREGADTQALEALIEKSEAALQQVQQDEQIYHEAIEQISQTIHPFTLNSLQWQTQRALLTNLASPLQRLWDLAPTYGAQKAQQAIDTFEAQITSFAQAIEAWQQWVTIALDGQTQDPVIRNWVLNSLLPWVYWRQQADKTRQPSLKRRYQATASDAFDRLFEQDLTLALTDHQREQWVLWCREFCAKYQRTSSAVRVPKTDFAFKKIFGSPQSTNILISFLNAMLYEGRPTIQTLSIIDPYQAPRIEGIKDSYLDVKAVLADGQVVIIEMQVFNVLGFKERVLYKAAKAFSIQLEVGDDYTMLNPVIALTITDFEMFEHSNKVVSRYRLKEKDDLTDYSDDIELVFAELPKFNKSLKQLSTLSDKWLFFLKQANRLESVPASLDEEPAIHSAFEVARQSRLTRDEIEVLERQSMVIHDSRNAVLLGVQQGIQQGVQQGLEAGQEQGERAARIEIARSLLERLSPEEISQITGLSPSEIERLR